MFSTMIIFIAVFALLIFAHEWGHFIAAKKQGIAVEEFGFGFPPRLFGFHWRGTYYTLNLIPLGGFVRINEGEEEGSLSLDSFANRPIHQRFFVVVAGVVMNIVLGWFLLTIGFMVGFPQTIDNSIPETSIRNRSLYIVSVAQGSPASTVSLRPGDELVSINAASVSSVDDVRDAIGDLAGTSVEVGVLHGDTTRVVTIVPERDDALGRAILGVGLQEVGVVSYPIHEALWQGTRTTGKMLGSIVLSFIDLVRTLVTSGKVNADLAGPVGIAVLTGQVAARGVTHLLQFAALLSLNLAVLNFLPIPALDGGKLFFLLLEGIRRKPVSKIIEANIHRFGFVALLLLVVVVTYKDIVRIFS